MTQSEIPVRILTPEQKEFVKAKLVEVNAMLQSWQQRYNEIVCPEKPLGIAGIKKKILDGSLDETFPEVSEARSVLLSFANEHIPFIDGSFEYVILCSFAPACKSIAHNRAKKIAAELNLNIDSIFEDLLHDAYCSILHSIYYFSKINLELSTFVIESLKRSIERQSRYNYAKLSAAQPDDLIDSYTLRVLQMESAHLTVEDIAQEMSISVDRSFEILQYMAPVVRVCSNPSSDSSSDETTYHLVEKIPDKHCAIDEADNIDTVEFLKGLFDETDECMLSFTREERDVLKAACSSNFERGWQSAFAKHYINQSTGKPYSRARIGQIYSAAVEKVKSFLEAA